MKKLLLILLSTLSLTAVAQQKKVAVYVTGEQNGISKVLGDKLVEAFAKSGKYTAVERTSSFLAELNKEHSYERSGAVNDNQIAELGVQFGVNYVCVADMTDVFGEKYISARLIDVETAEVVNTHNVSGEMNSMNTCVRMASEIASNLTKGTFTEQAIEEAEQKARLEAKRRAEQEAAERAKRQEQERKNAQERRYQQNEQDYPGYIDLGLPSGTLWKKYNEPDKYKYSNAVKTFGNKLPNDSQMKELLKYCKQVKTNGGCKFVGPNNHYIVLPYSGYIRRLEKIAVGENGFYLYRGYECNLLKLWGTGGYDLANGWDNDKYSIRLVIKRTILKK